MIESITICKEASFGDVPARMTGCAKISFVYGCNGSGKTTISRVIGAPQDYPHCKVNWAGGQSLETLVYNSDFVQENFRELADLKGIFTMGKEDLALLQSIEKLRETRDTATKDIRSRERALVGEEGESGKCGELESLELKFKERCWQLKTDHYARLREAFRGAASDKSKLRDRLLEHAKTNTSELLPLEDLLQCAETVFAESPETQPEVTSPDLGRLIAHEEDPVLATRVVGSADVDVSRMIQRLKNSDWVREGVQYFSVNDGICPFCQQSTEEKFAEQLQEYFDDSFREASQSITRLAEVYDSDARAAASEVEQLAASSADSLDTEALGRLSRLLAERLRINRSRIREKQREPSRSITLDSVKKLDEEIRALVGQANERIKAHNKTVAGLDSAREKLKNQVWRFFLDKEIRHALDAYEKAKKDITKAIESLGEKLKSHTEERNRAEAEIQELEKLTTSIQPTIDAINRRLEAHGFSGFRLARVEDTQFYRVVRDDGTDAMRTLSEGERTLVSFLYFHHLLRGSTLSTGQSTDRVVVLDDPVSSLDSEVLFMVSSMIRQLYADIRDQRGAIKQLFVFTHNIYFHKEVAMNRRGRFVALPSHAHWCVVKRNGLSNIEKHEKNPVSSSYDLLWRELRRESPSRTTIQNTMRRILESYFTAWGDIDLEKIAEKFEGGERTACLSLFAWAHDGSHLAREDLYICLDDSEVEKYQRVFKRIFEVMKHESHYRMMMRDDGSRDGAAA